MLHLFEDVRAAVDAAGRQGGVDAYEVQKRVLLVLMLEEVIVQAAEAAGWGDDLVASLKACLINESKEKYRVVGHEVEYLKVGIEHATDDRRPTTDDRAACLTTRDALVEFQDQYRALRDLQTV